MIVINLKQIGIALLVLLLGLSFFNKLQDDKWVVPKAADDIKNPIANDNKSIEKGKRIYYQICATCHGRSGTGDGPTASTLEKKPADHTSNLVQSQTDGALFYKISKGRDAMPSYNTALSKTQRWQVIRYLRTLKTEEK
ncbi:c-type cytochrome [Psychroserpens luteolus]|uniref:c-type cytochrome n=1 Tax=Psychroserpens luteolus TaxID=2855840 RepID=UPI001E30D8D3|nr:c-type cytochrome [Psychroserpens luteolus]MCD2259589.1 c-type cytochrome [Psychroserpens luteolus]